MRKILLPLVVMVLLYGGVTAQVSTVEFGKNRIQYKKFNWQYYQTRNFNSYYSEGGEAVAKFVTRVAEEELAAIEEFVEYGLQRRANIVIYNNFTDFRQSNIGLGIDWQNTGGVTKLVNNKIIVYYDGNLNELRIKIRQGIAKVLVENLLFGDDLGEFASNQALLDLPTWLTDGYVAYAAENWSPKLDNQLKTALLSGRYRSFYQFAFKEPELAGHAFWKYIADNYRKDNVTYFLYLSRIYKSLNASSLKVTKKKFKILLAEFMKKETTRFRDDNKGRKNQTNGSRVSSKEIKYNIDYYKFQPNPIARNNTFAVVEYKKGVYRVNYHKNSIKKTTLIKAGVLNLQDEINPNYPLLAWDPKGSRLLVIYTEEGSIKMFVYDAVARIKTFKQELEGFQLIQDAKFMLDNNTLILSGVKNGQSDIFVYKIKEKTLQQITNDPYDDLDGSFVAFPNKTGILFSSNRPSPNASKSDTTIASRNRFNIFMVDNWNKSEYRQISQLTNQPFGDAKKPLQYNVNHFTFISDASGISNRYAGFFSTKRDVVDTIYRIGDEVLYNPNKKELDSVLLLLNKKVVDSVGYVSITSDSTYVFPLTNYQSELLESTGAGDNNQVSEVRREGRRKNLYKLRIDETTLERRNIDARPTAYINRLIEEQRRSKTSATQYIKEEAAKPIEEKKNNLFQTEFEMDTKDTALKAEELEPVIQKLDVLKNAKKYAYKLKFSSDYVVSGFNNSVLVNRYQPYGGGYGPIYLSNTDALSGILRMGISDLMEDKKFIGGFRLGTNLKDNDYLASYQNLKKRFDWGITYYRSNQNNFPIFGDYDYRSVFPNNMMSNLYQFNVSYPFDEVKSLRAILGYRSDRVVIPADAYDARTITFRDTVMKFALVRMEYVHDNTINPALNIWNGLRYKVYTDVNARMVNAQGTGRFMFNMGTDLRYYRSLYRNLIWAGRAAADFSFGTQKLIYYLGGVEGWLFPKFNNGVRPAPDQDYAFQTLSLNLRGHQQNVANGNNTITFNSEFRLPLLSTLLNRPINNAFLRNLQVTQFVDLGTAWNGKFGNIIRPSAIYGTPPVQVNIKTGGIGPFVGGYGFGARSTLLGYFLRVDAGWPMGVFFKGKPVWYFALGLDF